MSIKNLIFWEKYRPKTIKGMVLLPRIEQYIIGEIESNLIFFGTTGTGKTTLAKIICNNYNSLTLNGKLGVGILSSKIKDHFESLNLLSKDSTKLIYIDEFDRASIELQDGLKSFIEEYPYARFIFTTNHIDKITPELRGRFNCISFDPINTEEREFLYKKQVLYLRSVAKKEEFEKWNDKKLLEKIISKNYPDLRSSILLLQHVIKNGDDSLVLNEIGSDKNDLFKFLLDGNLNPIIIYDYVMNNFFITFDDAFKYLSRPLFEYLKETQIDTIIDKGGAILKIQKEYNETLESTLDPLVHLVNYILDIKSLLKH